MSRNAVSHRAPRRAIGTVVLAVVLSVVAAGLPARAQAAAGQASPLTATRVPTGALSTAVQEDPPPPPEDAVGRPAAYTVASADDLLVDKTSPDATRSVRGWMTARADITDMQTRGPDGNETGRRLLRPDVATDAGRPFGDLRERAFSLRLKLAGDRALWVLGTDDDLAEGWGVASKRDAEPTPGHTYQLSMGSDAQTLTVPADARGFGEDELQLAGADADASRQQWAAVTLPRGNGWFKLVNRADGTCLNVHGGGAQEGTPIRTFYCDRGNVGDADSIAWRAAPAAGGGYTVQSATGLYLTRRGDGFVQASAAPQGQAATQAFTFTDLYPQGQVVPTWSFPNSDAWSHQGDVALGDLDRQVADDGTFRDEAVVAFTHGDTGDLLVRVLDYNADGGQLVERAPVDAPSISVGRATTGSWQPGSVKVGVGDFDGDLVNEFVVTWQDTLGAFKAMMMAYDGEQVSIEQRPRTIVPVTAQVKPSLVGGMADAATGDFDGDDSDDLAVAFASGDSANALTPWLASISFDGSGNTEAYGVAQIDDLAEEGTTPHLVPPPTGQAWTNHGLRLEPGRFTDSADYGLHRRQLAVGYSWAAGALAAVNGTNVRLMDVSRDSTSPDRLDVTPQGEAVGITEGIGSAEARNAPMSMVAGGFAGIGSGDTLPLSALAVYSWQESLSGRVPNLFLLRMGASGLEVSHSEHIVDDPSWHVNLTAFDRSGRSVILGAPVRLRVPTLTKLTALAAQPPAHADWLPVDPEDGAEPDPATSSWVNVARNGKFSVSMGQEDTSTYTTSFTADTSYELGVSEAAESETSVKAGLFGLEGLSGALTVGNKFNKTWQSSLDLGTTYKQTLTTTSSVSTGDDDVLRGVQLDSTVYRYPILGGRVLDKTGKPLTTDVCSPCHPFYEVRVPGPMTPVDATGSSIAEYQPVWQNGNVLSYPQLANHKVPASDVGTYTTPGANSTTTVHTGQMFNQHYSVGGNTSSYALNMAEGTGAELKRTSAGGISKSVEMKTSLGVKFDIGIAKVKETGTVSAGVDMKSTWATDSGSSTETESTKSFQVKVPRVASTHAYEVGTTYYTDSAGVPKVVHAVDLTSDGLGRDWWSDLYGDTPDLALNLPFATVMTQDDLADWTVPKFNPAYDRQRIRGFWALQPASSDSPVTSGQPYANAPRAGQPVVFSANVYNYSLKASPASTASFYAVPVDATKKRVTGEASLIGEVGVKAMDPQGMTNIRSPEWSAVGPTGGAGLQNYRIFVVLDRAGTTREIHEWKGGAACPTSEMQDPRVRVTDPMTGENDALACAQNNQGFGEVTVMSDAPMAGGPAQVALEGTTLGDGALLGAEEDDVDVVRGQRVHGSVHLSASSRSGDFHRVAVYDGAVSDGQLVALTNVEGVDAGNGGVANFTWTPRTAGQHTLTTVLTTSGGATEVGTQSVRVLAHGERHGLRLSPSHAVRAPGRPLTFRASVVDHHGNALDDVTGTTLLTATPGATCTRSTCSAARPGTYHVTGRHGDLRARASFTVEKALVARLRARSGTGQAVPPRATFPRRLRATATDAAGRPAVGAPVRFTVRRGSAAFPGNRRTTTVVTNRRGVAVAPPLTAGRREGRVVVRATSAPAAVSFVNRVTRPARDLTVRQGDRSRP